MKKMIDNSWKARGRGCQDRRCGRHTKWAAHRVDEEPVLVDDVGAEEEGGALEGLGEEVGREERDPLEDGEARAGLEHEHRDRLLEGEADDDRRPLRTPYQHTAHTDAPKHMTHQGMCEQCLGVAQKQNWKTKSLRTEIARSPYVVFCRVQMRATGY